MGESGTFRGAGRAGGVLDTDRVVELERRLALGQRRLVDRSAVGQQSLPIVFKHQNLAQLWAARPNLAQNVDVAGLAEPTRVDQQADARLVEGKLELGAPIGRVDVDQDGTDPGSRVRDDNPLVAV